MVVSAAIDITAQAFEQAIYRVDKMRDLLIAASEEESAIERRRGLLNAEHEYIELGDILTALGREWRGK